MLFGVLQFLSDETLGQGRGVVLHRSIGDVQILEPTPQAALPLAPSFAALYLLVRHLSATASSLLHSFSCERTSNNNTEPLQQHG